MKTYIVKRAAAASLALSAWLLMPQIAQCFYNPSTGRWLSRDPGHEPAGENLYVLVADDPVKRIDLLGLVVICHCPENYFNSLGMVKDIHYTESSPDHYVAKPGAQYSYGNSLGKLIVWRMLQTAAAFKASALNVKQLQSNIAAREAIVANAMAKRFKFSATGRKLNHTISPPPTYADIENFYRSINNPGTEIACQYATEIIFETGNHFSGFHIRPRDGLWIPGDWGYIRNQGFVRGRSPPGTNGENLIHAGNAAEGDTFWGHESDELTVLTEKQWFDEIRGWETDGKPGRPQWEDVWRIRGPKIGLE